MHQKIAVVRENPFGRRITFYAGRKFAVLFEFQTDLVADGLDLPRIGARTEDEIIGERGNSGKVQNFDVRCFFGLSGADGGQPMRDLGMERLSPTQNGFLNTSYYNQEACTDAWDSRRSWQRWLCARNRPKILMWPARSAS